MFTDDQLQFRDMVLRFLEDKSPPTQVRKLMETAEGYDPAVWQQMCSEVGLAGTHLPENYGGFGFGAVEMGIIAEQMGRHLYCGPYFSSALMAGYAILFGGEESTKERLLPAIADGSTIAALVLDDISASESAGNQIKSLDGRLNGRAKIVVNAHIADTLIVIARENNKLGLFQAACDDVTITPLVTVDPTRKISSIQFEATPAERIGGLSEDQLDNLWDHLSVALAHEMMGGAQRLFETTIEYMKMRVQFGRAIGSFQSLKHRCADLLLELEYAKAMTYESARYLATGEGDCYAPNMAKSMASEAYMSAAKQAIQLRGGIGFTWEEDTHLWFKRAKASEVFLGTPNWHRERMMQRIDENEVKEMANG